MDIKDDDIMYYNRPLTGFANDTTSSIGNIKLPIYIARVTRRIKFVVINRPSIYNIFLGTPWLYAMKVVASTYHQCVKFSNLSGTYTISGNQGEA